jgi:hypothetical protein
MSDPSLLNIPYRFKASKLYSQIPDSGLGDFVVSRSASNAATRVNASGFIETVADNVPRLDYPLGGIANGCPALLVEPSAQNTCLQSETFQSWAFTNASASSGNAAISPSNTQTAGLFIPNSGTTGRGEVACGTLSNATTYSFSCFIKTPTNSLTSVWLYTSDGGGGTGANRWGVEINLSNFTLTDYILNNGSVTSKAVENYGNGWYRVRVTGQVTSGIGGSSVAVVRKLTAGADTNGINGVLVWGAQFETGSIATSYIPTTTAAITRGADLVSKTGVSSLIGQTEGTIYAEVVLSRVNANPLITISDGTDTNRIQIAFASPTSLVAIIRITTLNVNYTVTIPTIPATGGVYKMALGYKTDDYCFALNGTAYANAASRGVPACNKIGLGTSATDGAFLNDRIRAAALYTTRLPNDQLQALTTL